MYQNLRTVACCLATVLFVSPAALADNWEVVVPEGNDLVHYWAERGQPWNRGKTITDKADGPGSLTLDPDNQLHVVVREGATLRHYWSKTGAEWEEREAVSKKATGPGAIVLNTTANRWHVVVPEGGDL